MFGIQYKTITFLVIVSLYLGSVHPTLGENNNFELKTIADDYMTLFMKEMKDNEKVLCKDGKIALMENYSKATTIVCGVTGLIFTTVGGFIAWLVLNLPYRHQDFELVMLAAMIAGFGIGLDITAVYRLINHFQENVYLVLDQKGLIERKVRKLNWSDVHKIEIDNVRTYNSHGSVIVSERFLCLLNKLGTILFSVSEKSESLPIPFDNFITLMDYYWNQHKSEIIK